MKFTIAALTGLTTVALASPTFQLEKRAAQTTCGRYDQISEAPYTIYTDLWGEDGYTGNGNGQCLTYNTVSGGAVSWSSNWTWTGGPYQVKSYSNVGLQMSPVQVSRIQSIPSTWSWSYTGQNLVVDGTSDPTLLRVIAATMEPALPVLTRSIDTDIWQSHMTSLLLRLPTAMPSSR